MLFKGMLKWTIAREDGRTNSTKSLRKRRKLLGSSLHQQQNNVNTACETELIDGYKLTSTNCSNNSNSKGNSSPHNCKHRFWNSSPGTRTQLAHHDDGRKTCTTCTTNCTQTQNNYNKNGGDGADSKSLLYMSLDQLPFAIVKQYERMLQENPGSNNNNNDSINIKYNSQTKILPLPKNSTSLPTRTKSLENVSQIETTKCATNPNEIIRQAHNRHLKTSTSLLRTTSLASADKKRKNLSPIYCDFKYSNFLRSSGSSSSTTSSSSDYLRSAGRENRESSRKYSSFKLSPIKSSTLPRRGKGAAKIGDNNSPTTGIYNQRLGPNLRPPFKNIRNLSSKEIKSATATETSNEPFSHDLTDPQFLEKSVSFTVPATAIPSIRCAKKLTLKRSELRKLERIQSQTERLNRFLKKYYHDCLPNLPEEEDEHYSPEAKSISSVLRTHWTEDKIQEISQNFMLNSSTSTSSTTSSCSTNSNGGRNSPLSSLICDLEGRAIRWRNLKNAGAFLPFQPSNDSTLLPIIQEDTETSSILSDNCRIPPIQEFHRDSHLNRNFDNLNYLTAQQDNANSEESTVVPVNAALSITASGSLVTPAEFGKLKGAEEPFGVSFEKIPTSNHQDHSHGRASPHPSSSSFSILSPVHHYKDDVLANGMNAEHATATTSAEEPIPRETVSDLEKGDTDTDHENANYPSENETWYSHEFLPCESNVSLPETPTSSISSINIQNSKDNNDIPSLDFEEDEEDGKERQHEDEVFIPSTGQPNLTLVTPSRRTGLKSRNKTPSHKTPQKKFGTPLTRTPRKLVRKPHVTTAYTGKGEVLIRTYCNGGYVTVHVVQAKNLQTCYRSSWNLGIKISLLPEAEETLTKFESIPVNPHRTWVKIDQKFSFEALPYRKVFFTLWKRLEKGRTSFLGWTTLDLGLNKNTQSWFKLRKKKMSTNTCVSSKPQQQHFNNQKQTGSFTTFTSTVATPLDGFLLKKGKNTNNNTPKKGIILCAPTPIEIATVVASVVEISESNPEMDALGLLMNEPRSQLQTSSTMDSGVEDCCSCEPCDPSGPPTMLPPPTSDSDLEESDGLGPGYRVTVKMLKNENVGFGFSVVWVSPPRIERLEKNKTADLAGLHIGDLIIGVNGEDVSSVPNTTIYHKMKTTGNELVLELWRKSPMTTSHHETCCTRDSVPIPIRDMSPSLNCPKPPSSFSSSGSGYSSSLSNGNGNINNNNNSPPTRVQPPPVSILKPPPPAPPTCSLPPPTLTSAQPTSTSSSWKIRFNIELLDNEDDDLLKQFFICELKFFRKIVAALDRYLIPAQANNLLNPQEMHLIFAHLIKIITMTKRILQCVANSTSRSDWQLGKMLFSTHSDHLSELTAAYSQYGKNLGGSAMILANKMTSQIFAKFVLETSVPKGHLDMTSLVFAPLEHLRNLCEICDEIAQTQIHWSDIACQLKECYADIVCETDYMEPISHISMKKNPLLSVRDLEKRIVSTSCQNFKVSEKGRKWLFGSRLFRKESDGSWTPVWAFLFTDIIVLTSHTTRDRVFFVKESPIRLGDVVTLHFNLPRKNENEFRLLFGPELPHQSRLDKLLPMKNRNKKPDQIVLRTSNLQLKSMWKLLLQRQIITLNTRISKSSSSNFSISEFCEKFPDENHSSPIIEEEIQMGEKTEGKHQAQDLTLTSTSHSASDSCPNGNIVKCQVQVLNPPKPIQSNSDSDTSTKCFPIKSTTTVTRTSEWSSPLEIHRNGVILQHVKPSTPVLTEDHKLSRVAPTTADPNPNILIEQVKVTERTDETLKLTAKLTTNTEPDIDTQKPKPPPLSGNLNQPESQPHVKITEDELNRNVNVVSVNSDVNSHSLTPSQGKSTSNTSTKTNNNNNNNEGIFNLNANTKVNVNVNEFSDDKCQCEITQHNLIGVDVRESESSNRKLESGEKRVELVEAIKPDVPKPLTITQNNGSPSLCHIKTFTKVAVYSPLVKPKSGTFTLRQLEEVASELGETRQGQMQTNDELSKGTMEAEVKYQHNIISALQNPSSPQLCVGSSQSVTEAFVPNNNVRILQSGTKIKTNATLLMKTRNLEHQGIGSSPATQSNQNNNKIDEITSSTENESFPKENAEPHKIQNPLVKPIHTDSPIISGFGSERKRRILCDYKVRRDYPELFGITPRDRRTFIKSLAQKVIADEKEKGLVAPYYYMTPSPLPIPKHIRNLQLQKQQQQQQQVKPQELIQPPVPKPRTGICQPSGQKIIRPIPTERSKIQASILAAKEVEWQAHLQKFAEAAASSRAKGIPRKPSQEILEDLLEDESEGHAGLNGLARAQIQRRQRSPEESSSNDSGISEEIPPDKFKLTKKMNRVNEFDVAESKFPSRFNSTSISTRTPSTMEVISTSHFPSSTCTSSSSAIDNTALAVCPNSPASQPKNLKNNKTISFYEGDPTASVAPMVALTSTTSKADKATATEDDISAQIFSDKTFSRNFIAQKREAFFLHGQSPSLSSPSAVRRMTLAAAAATVDPFKVKINPGNSVQQPQWTAKQPSTSTGYSNFKTGNPWASCDQVQYTRLEKEKTARVERVESSDDSTSSDVASASPAPENENGTTDPSWSSSSSSLTGGFSCSKEGLSSSILPVPASSVTFSDLEHDPPPSCSSAIVKPVVPAYYHLTKGPEIVVTNDSPSSMVNMCDNSDDESDNEKDNTRSMMFRNGSSGSVRSTGHSCSGGGLVRVESNDSTAENYGDDDEEYNFEDDEEDDLSHCSLATINRYGTYESLEKIESEDTVGCLPEFTSTIPRSKARFTFEDEEEEDVIDDENLFEEDFESDFNFRFPSQIQDNTYSVSRLGPLPPLLEEDFEDEMYEENGSNSNSPGSSSDKTANTSGTLRPSRQETGLRRDNSFLLTRIATMYARTSISPLKILRELWLKKRYREWAYKE